ncbi:MAG: hypothetical protein IPJ58_13165 [Ardenticatenia bacterium]|nr:hypothetical protein [Ardenticatenia bacterium]
MLVDPSAQLGVQVHLPILNFEGQDDVCRAMIEVQYIGCDPRRKAVLVAWGDPGFCPPRATGPPKKVECTGPAVPKLVVDLMGAEIPTGSKGRHAVQVHGEATVGRGHRPGLRRRRGRPDVRDAVLRRGRRRG